MKRIAFILALLIIFALPTTLALAASRNDRIIPKGKPHEGDITVYDDDELIVEEGGVLDGNLVVFDGDVKINGIVTGDVVIMGGDFQLSGKVEGNLTVFSGNLDIDSAGQIDGECFSRVEVDEDTDNVACSPFPGQAMLANVPFLAPSPPDLPESPEEHDAQPDWHRWQNEVPDIFRGPNFADRPMAFILNSTGRLVGQSLLLGILALVITAVFPQQLRRVSDTIQRQPAASGAIGLLTAVAGPSLIVILLLGLLVTCIGVLLYPAVFLLALALVAAAVMGWIAVGDILGRMVLRALRPKAAEGPLAAAFGTMILTLLLGVLTFVPFVWGETLLAILLACVGLGAAALTLLGTKPYPPGFVRPHKGKMDVTPKI